MTSHINTDESYIFYFGIFIYCASLMMPPLNMASCYAVSIACVTGCASNYAYKSSA